MWSSLEDCWDPKLDHQTERGKVSFKQTVQHRGMICTIVIAYIFTKCSTPYNVGWEGVFIPPTLLQHSKYAPSVFPEVKRLHQGYLVIPLGKTVQLVHSYLDHMFRDSWQPSVSTFGRLRVASPSVFATEPSAESRRFLLYPLGGWLRSVPGIFEF